MVKKAKPTTKVTRNEPQKYVQNERVFLHICRTTYYFHLGFKLRIVDLRIREYDI